MTPTHATKGPFAARPGTDVGDKGRSFLPLFLRHQERILAYVLALQPSRSDADDVVQEASLTMWEKFDPASPPPDFVGWACTIARFKVLEHRRKCARSKVLFRQDVFDKIAAAAAERIAAETHDAWHDALTGCMQKLLPGDRELLAWRFAPNATTQSVADRAGRSIDAVYKALAKARRALADCVDRTLARGDR